MADNGAHDPGRGYVGNCTVLEEVENHVPTDEEVRMYAKAIGIDPDKEADLLYIAREGISAPVPSDWIVLQDRKGGIFYQHKPSGVCIWEHPLDAQFRLRVVEAKSKKLNCQKVKSGESAPALNESTPVKTETVYQALPTPRTCLNAKVGEFKVPSLPQKTANGLNTNLHSTEVDSPSTSVSERSFSAFNLPHVNLSPTCTSRQRKAFSEINANNGTSFTKASSQRSHDTDENAYPAASTDALVNLADRFTSAVRISVPSRNQSERHRRYSNTNSVRRLFYVPDGDVTSCLYSPPESPKPRPRHHCGDKVRPRTTETPVKPEMLASPAGKMMVELDGNLSVQYLLEEQKRLHEKIAFLKVTYKAYKLRLANVNASIKMIQSTAAAAAVASSPTFQSHSAVIDASGSGFRASPSNHSNSIANSAPLRPESTRRLTAESSRQNREMRQHHGSRRQRARSIQNGAAGTNSRSNV
ncbi:unnamed protein product [Hydatigera taeniaeformis]|uniref:WW domain-containing protein n=1 Tax=Hydatigena taeniaeformis TaxID=6205 RepID=A0A0R3WK55_HYDTA|nr:unnamed protein product [Hydatigera taeniaeformis]